MEKNIIYHYTKCESAIGIIKSKTLRLSSSLGMEDKTERFFASLYATALILASKDPVVTELRSHLQINDIITAYLDSLQIPFYSASFCENKNNQYLWENYAGNHKGVCMGFNKEYLLKQMRTVLSNNFIPFDPDENVVDYIKDIVPLRTVYYKEAEQFVTDVIKKTSPLDDDHYIKISLSPYKSWLVRVFAIVAGVIKAENFKDEKEVRLLFQNPYTEDYMASHPMYCFDFDRFKNSMSKLGLCKIISNVGKEYYELKLEEFFTSELIPEII